MSLTITRPAIPVPLPLSRGGLEATTPAGGRATLELGDLALLTAPGGTSTFLRADKTWAVPPGGGGGSTTLLGLTDVPDTYTGQATKVLAVKADETGTEFITPATGGGAPTDAEYITSIAHASLSAERVLTDTATITWDRATAGQIKANAAVTSYTDEQAQDAIGAMLLDTATIDLTYTDATPSLSATVNDNSITEAKLSLSDVTTRDASTTVHGLLRKLSGTATQYLDGSGAWTTPAGAGDTLWTRNPGSPLSLATGLLACWRMEEASGNRVDSVSGYALVPQGTVGTITNAAGKIGQALAMNGTAGTYLSVADNATLSVGANTSFTVGCWVWINATGTNMGFVGKGSAAVSTNNAEYMLWYYTSQWQFTIGSGASSVLLASPTTPVVNTWTLLIAWYDHVADIQYLQVNNGTPAQVANTGGSHDSTAALEVGRPLGRAEPLNGRVDLPCFWKRVLTAQERSDLWNSGTGLDYATIVGPPPFIRPTTSTDLVVVGSTVATSTEPLESAGGLKLGNALGTTDGTLRWSGTDFEGRKAGAWVTLTATAGQPLDATLTALAGLTTAADRLPYFTGVDTAALATFTAAGRTLAGAADAAAQRTALALGTIAQQDASAVAITGGTALGLNGLQSTNAGFGSPPVAGYSLVTGAGYLSLADNVVIGAATALGNVRLELAFNKTTHYGIRLRQLADAGAAHPVLFANAAGTEIGSISSTGSAVAYNTTSDGRFKEALEALPHPLAVIQALNPVTFRWKVDGSQGHGLVAQEVEQVVPGVVSGRDGAAEPMGIDYGKLVPWLIGACQELAAQVEVLTARLTAAGV